MAALRSQYDQRPVRIGDKNGLALLLHSQSTAVQIVRGGPKALHYKHNAGLRPFSFGLQFDPVA